MPEERKNVLEILEELQYEGRRQDCMEVATNEWGGYWLVAALSDQENMKSQGTFPAEVGILHDPGIL